MLSQLKISNFGLIDEMSIDFSSDLNIFTGETGAGKSILIGALQYCLGGRIKNSQIRNTDKNCTIETVFELSPAALSNIPGIEDYLDEV